MFKNIIIAALIIFILPIKMNLLNTLFLENTESNEIVTISENISFNDTFENNLNKLDFEDSNGEGFEFTNF